MPTYDYVCLDCAAKSADAGAEEETVYESSVFETYHSMNPSPEDLAAATKCPRCGGTNCNKSFFGYNITTYLKGHGWLDVAGRKRDMHLFKLENDDPYKKFRQVGEADDIKQRLKNAGKHNPKTQYFTGGSGGNKTSDG